MLDLRRAKLVLAVNISFSIHTSWIARAISWDRLLYRSRATLAATQAVILRFCDFPIVEATAELLRARFELYCRERVSNALVLARSLGDGMLHLGGAREGGSQSS